MDPVRFRCHGRLVGACCLALLSSSQIIASNGAERSELPTISESAIVGGVRVTLLDARPVTQTEYLQAEGHPPPDWAGGAFRLLFFVENRPGQPGPPVLGNVRVLLGATQYNSVTNAISGRPFSPYVVIHPTDGFSSTQYGRQLQDRIPQPRPGAVHGVLDFFVRGGPIPNGQPAVVELEQGETFQPPDAQRSTAPKASETVYHWVRFKF